MHSAHKFANPRILEKRRGVRLNSRIQVAIEWDDTVDGEQREEALTRVVGSYGCLVVLSRELALEQRLRVVNVSKQQSIHGVVVWKGMERPEGWEVGIALVQPPEDFWGFDL